MDVQTKDGILLKGIPDGTPDEAIKARIEQIRSKGYQSTAGGAATGMPQILPQNRGGQTTDIPNVIGGNAAEFATQHGASPEVAGATGAAVNTGMNAIPMLVGSGLGAATGRAMAPVARFGGNLVKNVGNILDQKLLAGGLERAAGRTAVEAAGKDLQPIINQLRAPTEIVPGSMPTAGQAAAPVGRAEFSGLQEAVKTRAPSEYESQSQAQNAARIKLLRTVGQDKNSLESSMANRASTAAQNYGAVRSQPVKIDEELGALLGNPIIQSPLKRAALLSAGRGAPIDISSGTITVGNLQDMKMALDDVIKDPQTFGIGASEAGLIGKLQKQLVKITGEKSPGWEKARATFAEQSQPINQMQVGQYLEGKLAPALSDFGAPASQRSTSYAQALRDAPGTLKRATGQPRYDELSKVLTPEQMNSVSNVGSDLARDAAHHRLATAGASKAGEIIGDMMPKVPSAGMLSPKYSMFRAAVNQIEGKAGVKALDKLAEIMRSPEKTADLLEKMSPREKSIITRLLSSNKTWAGAGAAAGGALGNEQGNQ